MIFAGRFAGQLALMQPCFVGRILSTRCFGKNSCYGLATVDPWSMVLPTVARQQYRLNGTLILPRQYLVQ